MKKRNTFTRLITLAIALTGMAAIGAFGTAGRVSAIDHGGLSYWTANYGSAGLVPGQTLLVSFANPNVPEAGSAPVRGHVKLFKATGSVLAQSEEVVLQPGHFHTFSFPRNSLSEAGEPGTGRLQVRAQLNLVLSDDSARISTEHFATSVEVVNNRTGETKVYQSGSVGWVKIAPDL